jgi:hypothetical protein
MVKRIELIRLEDRRDALERIAEQPVAGEAVTAPDLGGRHE